MANTLVKLNVHIVFHVKSTGIKMRDEDLGKIFAYIGGIINGIGGIAIEVGGVNDHIHIVTSLPKTKSLSDFVKIIKAYSSRWIKSIDKYYERFVWQEGYGAFSISPALIDKTINYVRNQSTHHKKTAYQDEYKSILKEYGIQCKEEYLFND